VPEDRTRAEKALYEMLVRRAFGEAGEQVVIEERLYGQELSVLALSDGRTVAVLPPAQDYKRAFDGDQGPNTGGMGAYAPVPFVSQELLEEIQRTILQPAVDGLRKEGIPYVGVLYAGLMLTAQGPRVLEFNCRFGDPETQVILPLLESDLVELIQACIAGKLKDARLAVKPAAVVTVVLASRGYPGPYEKGMVIQGLERAEALEGVLIFHAGTRRAGQQIVTSGGRVLNVTAVAPSLPDAVARAYEAVQHISFEGMHYRRDIGQSAVQAMAAGGGDGA
jgi:phosphoribosylamine--glycine ligase